MFDCPRKLRIASVSYLNARPLIEGLDAEPEIELRVAVPSALLDMLRGERADAALLPVIDYQRMDGLVIVPAGGIGSDGPTLTVRIFSRVPIENIRSLACDSDSHTSVALARIILARKYGLRPEFRDLARASDHRDEARLLIGDKVITDAPAGFEHQLDLGEAWKALTGLPFIFAVWMARPGDHLRHLYDLLTAARRRGLESIERIVAEHAVSRGWPSDLSRQYLTKNLQFEIGARQLEAIERFHALAAEENIIPAAHPLHVFSA